MAPQYEQSAPGKAPDRTGSSQAGSWESESQLHASFSKTAVLGLWEYLASHHSSDTVLKEACTLRQSLPAQIIHCKAVKGSL